MSLLVFRIRKVRHTFQCFRILVSRMVGGEERLFVLKGVSLNERTDRSFVRFA